MHTQQHITSALGQAQSRATLSPEGDVLGDKERGIVLHEIEQHLICVARVQHPSAACLLVVNNPTEPAQVVIPTMR